MSRLLTVGCHGEDVQQIQSMLNGQPPTEKSLLVVDGIFGPLTRARVDEYQHHNELRADGIVGPATSASLRRRLRLVPKRNGYLRISEGVYPRPELVSFASFRVASAPHAGKVSPPDPLTNVFNIGPEVNGVHHRYAITAIPDPKMPTIDIDLEVDGAWPPGDVAKATQIIWEITVEFDPKQDSSFGNIIAGAKTMDPDSFGPFSHFKGHLTMGPGDWGGKIRGGRLTIKASGNVFGKHLESFFHGGIEGTNPSLDAVKQRLNNELLWKIVSHGESGGRQFEKDKNPAFGIVPKFCQFDGQRRDLGRGDGGVGISAYTHADVTADHYWNWQINADAAITEYNKKLTEARRYGSSE
jgi:peptidoglycan hydrolase-like protein with peptidoglycan-binding domain